MPHLTEELAYWINERHAIKLRRERGRSKPWSEDPIFRTVRFCNVHREDDAVTIWMRQNWSTHESPAWWFVLGRMLNWVPTLESIVEYGVCGAEGERGPDALPTLNGLKEGLKATRATGTKVFTSAYTISTCGKSMDKIDYVCDWVCQAVRDGEEHDLLGDNDKIIKWPIYSSLQDTWSDLCRVDGLGSFLAAQVVADMKNTKGHALEFAPDWWSWSAPGPGSLRGLSWYFHGEPSGVTAGAYQSKIEQCMAEVNPFVDASVPRLCAQNFQNALCEFSKYMKVKLLGGHVRNKYQGT